MKTNIIIKGTGYYYFSKPVEYKKSPNTEQEKKKAAEGSIYQNGKGLYCPSKQIKAAMINGSYLGNMKLAKSLERAKQFIASDMILLNPDEIPFICKEKPEIIKESCFTDSHTLIWNYYARIKNWKLQFDMIISELIGFEFAKEALQNAGYLAKIGGRRKYNGGFEIEKFEKID